MKSRIPPSGLPSTFYVLSKPIPPSPRKPATGSWSISITAWRVMPTGKLKEAFDKEVQEQIPEPPCGRLGYAVDTVSFFMAKDGMPDRVIYVDLGQERAMLDITTLRLK